jgi:hypothetical protein
MPAKKLAADAPAANAAPEAAAAAAGAGGAADAAGLTRLHIQPCAPAVKTEDSSAGDKGMADFKEVPMRVCVHRH